MEDNFNQEFDDMLFGDPLEGQDPQETQAQQDPEQPNDTPNDQDQDQGQDYLTRLLQDRGIDKNKIKFSNEVGETEEYSFDDLSDDDKYNILKDQPLPITDEEIKTLNYLRQNNMSIQDFANWQRDEAVKEYLAQNQSYTTDIDSLSDDQVYAFDIISRFGEDISDEEIDREVELAKQDPDGFNKKVQLLRDQYKKQEEQMIKAQEDSAQEQRQQAQKVFVDNMINAAEDVNEIQGVVLEDADKNAILDFILEDNPQGQSGFAKALQDPKTLFKLAWFALYGEDTFNSTVDYFKNEIAKARRGSSAPTKVVQKQKPLQADNDPFNLDDIFN